MPTEDRARGEATSLRVIIGEDEVLLREGIARLLEDAGLDVVGRAADAEDLLRQVAARQPDIAVVDVRMPPDRTDDGLRAAAQIRERHPDTTVLVLSQYLEERYPLDLIGDDPEGVGYLLKDRIGDVRGFIEAVRRVAAGGSVLDREVVARMLGRRRRQGRLADLTAREREVLALMAEGKSNQGIAQTLVLGEGTVEKHVSNILGKLGLSSRTQAALWAAHQGLVEP
jgi:DNA-binding NarL/FixJ family response regulator